MTLPIIFTTPRGANAADNGLDTPVCTGTWTESSILNYADLSQWFGKVIPRNYGKAQVCGALVRLYNNKPSDSDPIAMKKDDGWRIWFKPESSEYLSQPIGGSELDIESSQTDYGGINRTSMGQDNAYISYAVLAGAKRAYTSYFKFEKTSDVMVFQIKLQKNAAHDADYSDTVYPVFYSIGGVWGNEIVKTPWLAKNGLASWTASNTPTRTGYMFKEWATDQAGQHPVAPTTTTLKNGTRLYAQWEKTAGDPQKVDLDCSTGGRCELTVNYSGSTAKTREFQPGSGALAWSGSPVTGVRLDASGYAADGACSDTRCWYVSLDKEPNQQGAYQAQMPTTGAPDGLSSVGLVALSVSILGVALTVLRRRS